MKRLFTLMLAFIMIASLFTGCAAKEPAVPAEEVPVENAEEATPAESAVEPVVTLKLGHQIAETSPEGIAAQAFADMVKEKSNGEIEIIVYPQEQLGAAAVMLESVMLGTLDMTLVAGQFLGSYEPTMSMTNVPYLFKTPDAYRQVLTDTGLMETQKASFHDAGFTLVNTERNFFRGARCIASAKPIRSAEDLKGLRFRAFENDVYVTSYTKLGTTPLIVAWGETFAALQNNTVEASCCSIDQLYGMGFAQVCPYITWTKEYYAEVIMVANNGVWDKLSAEHQQILHDAANEAGRIMEAEVEKSTASDVERITTEHNAEFIEMDTTPLRDALVPYYYELEETGVLPKGTVDSVLSQG